MNHSIHKVVIGFLGFLLGAGIMAAIIAPLLYWVVDAIAPGMFPFRRIFNRALMISALVQLFPLANFWKIRSWKQLGIVEKGWWRKWLNGVGWGCVTIFALLFFEFIFGHRTFSGNVSLQKAGEIILTAIAVGLLEEILFRGLLFYSLLDLLKKKTWGWAVVLSAFFATMHFLKAKGEFAVVNWWSGWEILGNIFPDSMASILPRWISLFLVGMVLCAVVWRWRSLWLAIGLHSGWVLILQLSYKMTSHAPLNIWFGQDLITGIVPSVFLAVLLWFIVKYKNESIPKRSH